VIAGLACKGDSWNESAVAPDLVTGRPVRRLTAAGYSEKPTYHTNTAFTADGEYLVFVSGRGEQSAVMKAHLASGELTQLTGPVPGLGGRWELHKCGPSRFCNGQGINGTTLCIAPRSRQALFFHGRALRAVHLDTLAERTLLADIGTEYDFPEAVGYGHVSADPRRQAIILDGNVTKDMLMWLYWDAETPRLEPICRHATEWDSLWGQLLDPHPAADPTGRRIAFNAAHGGRSDVYTAEVEPW